MSTVALPADLSPPLSVVPNRRTQRIARALIQRTPYVGGEATLSALRNIPADQVPALVYTLARAAAGALPDGIQLPPALMDFGERAPVDTPNAFTFAERREAHRRYRSGDRSPVVMAGEREYQRNRRKPRPDPNREG